MSNKNKVTDVVKQRKIYKGLIIGLSSLGAVSLAGSIAGPIIAYNLTKNNGKGGEDIGQLKGIKLDCTDYGQLGYTLTENYLKVYSEYTSGQHVKLSCGGTNGYKISINNVDVTNTFATQGYTFTEVKTCHVVVTYNSYTLEHDITVVLETTSITNNSESTVVFDDLPFILPKGKGVLATYSVSDKLCIDLEKSSIMCGSTNLIENENVSYACGRIIIPSDLVTGDIVIKLVTTTYDLANARAYCKIDTDDQIQNLISQCEEYENEEISFDKFISSIKYTAYDEDEEEIDEYTFKKSSELIGTYVEFKYNGLDRSGYIVGIEHDTIADGELKGKKAAITLYSSFIAKESGDYLYSKYNESTSFTNNPNYLYSQLRKNLTGNCLDNTKTIEWLLWDDEAETYVVDTTQTKSVFDMISDDETGTSALANAMKNVSKNVYAKDTDDQYKIITYSDKIFSFTPTELGYSNSKIVSEGSVYEQSAISLIEENEDCGYCWFPGLSSSKKLCTTIWDSELSAYKFYEETNPEEGYSVDFGFCI